MADECDEIIAAYIDVWFMIVCFILIGWPAFEPAIDHIHGSFRDAEYYFPRYHRRLSYHADKIGKSNGRTAMPCRALSAAIGAWPLACRRPHGCGIAATGGDMTPALQFRLRPKMPGHCCSPGLITLNAFPRPRRLMPAARRWDMINQLAAWRAYYIDRNSLRSRG